MRAHWISIKKVYTIQFVELFHYIQNLKFKIYIYTNYFIKKFINIILWIKKKQWYIHSILMLLIKFLLRNMIKTLHLLLMVSNIIHAEFLQIFSPLQYVISTKPIAQQLLLLSQQLTNLRPTPTTEKIILQNFYIASKITKPFLLTTNHANTTSQYSNLSVTIMNTQNLSHFSIRQFQLKTFLKGSIF